VGWVIDVATSINGAWCNAIHKRKQMERFSVLLALAIIGAGLAIGQPWKVYSFEYVQPVVWRFNAVTGHAEYCKPERPPIPGSDKEPFYRACW
jgi:hypothetical protein